MSTMAAAPEKEKARAAATAKAANRLAARRKLSHLPASKTTSGGESAQERISQGSRGSTMPSV
jgi:hypothetical protein